MSPWLPPWLPPTRQPTYMTGLRADRLGVGPSPNTIIIERGCFAEMNGWRIWTLPVDLEINPMVVGPNGRDTVEPFAHGDAIYTFLIRNPSTGEIAGLLSREFDYVPWVKVPAGWEHLRKHPLALNWRNTWAGGGFFDFLFTGIQNPRIEAGIFGTTGEFQIPLPNGGHSPTNQLQSINLAPFIPGEVARLVHLRYAITPTGGRAGTSYIGAQNPIIELGAANPALGGATWGDIDVRVTGPPDPTDPSVPPPKGPCNIVFWNNVPDITLSLWLRGYTITEVTS